MYTFNQALETLASRGRLERVTEAVSLEEIPQMIRKSDTAFLFENTGTGYRIASNLCTRENFCALFDMEWKELQERVVQAFDNPIDPVISNEWPFEDVEADLRKLPVLKYYDSDPGPYITAGVFVTECETRNLSYHRILVKGKDTCTTRICHRHTWECYTRNDRHIDVAVCL
ncbi:MAG: UbiD family decarboxylase, partial [Theionarchaea archaeon]|nr:UbiD family decarboxylase [Theionarchaea archaeon]